jgi:hypothetical protein
MITLTENLTTLDIVIMRLYLNKFKLFNKKNQQLSLLKIVFFRLNELNPPAYPYGRLSQKDIVST